MKCPCCGANLQENAQFCFYCMHTLDAKQNVAPTILPKNRKKYVIRLSVTVVVAVLLVVLLLWLMPFNKRAVPVDEPTEPIIVSFDDFQLRATYLTGKNGISGLWNPDAFIQTNSYTDKEGDRWQNYTTDVFADEMNLQAYFCEGGTEILMALTDLTDETMDDGLEILECTVSSVYNYTFTNLQDILINRDLYPAEEIQPQDQILNLAGFPDSTWDRQDPGTEATIIRKAAIVSIDGQPEQLMHIELRTRVFQESTYYDIFVLHVVGEEE